MTNGIVPESKDDTTGGPLNGLIREMATSPIGSCGTSDERRSGAVTGLPWFKSVTRF